MHSEKTKRLVLLLSLLSLCLTTAVLLPRTGARAEPEGDILRLHVIANSDSAADQTVKLRVRDAILAFLPETDSAAEATAFLMENGGALQSIVESTLAANGFPYGAQLMLGTYPFPERVYGETVYPAGDYEALRVILGSGSGRNWWCVLFPPLCIVTEEAEKLPDAGDVTFESSVASWWRRWRAKETCA